MPPSNVTLLGKLYILERLYNIKWISVTANDFSVKGSWHILQTGDKDGSREGGRDTLQVFRLNLSSKQDLFREKSYNHTINKETFKMGLEYCHLKCTHPLPSNGALSLKQFHSPTSSENAQGKFLQRGGEPNI